MQLAQDIYFPALTCAPSAKLKKRCAGLIRAIPLSGQLWSGIPACDWFRKIRLMHLSEMDVPSAPPSQMTRALVPGKSMGPKTLA